MLHYGCLLRAPSTNIGMNNQFCTWLLNLIVIIGRTWSSYSTTPQHTQKPVMPLHKSVRGEGGIWNLSLPPVKSCAHITVNKTSLRRIWWSFRLEWSFSVFIIIIIMIFCTSTDPSILSRCGYCHLVKDTLNLCCLVLLSTHHLCVYKFWIHLAVPTSYSVG